MTVSKLELDVGRAKHSVPTSVSANPASTYIQPVQVPHFFFNEHVAVLITRLDPEAAAHIAAMAQDRLPLALRNAVAKRKAEYLIGRACAAQLLHRLEAPSFEVGTGKQREPLWPEGFTGSMTHSKWFAAVAVASTTTVRSLGIDMETIMDKERTEAVIKLCLRPEEHCWLEASGALSQGSMCTLIFSAKEAFFKCLYPIVQKYFDFKDAAIEAIDFEQQRLRMCLQRGLNQELPKGLSLQGNFRFLEGHVLTAFELPLQKEC